MLRFVGNAHQHPRQGLVPELCAISAFDIKLVLSQLVLAQSEDHEALLAKLALCRRWPQRLK